MRKMTLLLALLAVAAAPAVADAKAKAKKPAAAKPAAAKVTNPNEPGHRFIANGLSQVIVPFQSLAKASAPAKPIVTTKRKSTKVARKVKAKKKS